MPVSGVYCNIVNHDAAPDPGAEDQPHRGRDAARRAKGGLGQGEGPAIVDPCDGPARRAGDIRRERFACHRKVRCKGEAGHRVHQSGGAQSDR